MFSSRTRGDVFNRNINIVTPKRKNQKNRTSLNDKHLLKDRYKIEHVFAKIKSNNHIMVRTEKTITNYLSFIYISFLPQKMLFIYLIIIINDVNIIYNNN